MVNSGVFSQIIEEAGLGEGDLMVFASIMFVYFAFIGIIVLAMYLLEAIGLYGMAKKSRFLSPWRSFIPFANTFLFGKIAEKYQRRDGKPSAKFSVLLLVFEILTLVFVAAFFVFFINMCVILFADMNSEAEITIAIGRTVIPMIFSCLVLVGVSIAYAVMYYIALWRIFAAFDYNNATVYLVLSIVFSFLGPIFLFVLRNKEPVFDPKEHFNYLYNNQK